MELENLDKVFVYKLKDKDGSVFYIGKTIDQLILGSTLKFRLRNQLKKRNINNKEITVEIIDKTYDNQLANEWVLFWTDLYKKWNYNLIGNSTELREKKVNGPHKISHVIKNPKKVYQYDSEGNFIMEWRCVKDAAKELKLPYSSIYNSIVAKRKNATANFRDFKADNVIDSPLSSGKIFIQYDLEMNQICEFRTLKEASEKLNIPSSNIFLLLKGKRKNKDFILKYK